MTFVLEISRPMQWLPKIHTCTRSFRFVWLLFGFSIEHRRYDEIIKLANEQAIVWGGGDE